MAGGQRRTTVWSMAMEAPPFGGGGGTDGNGNDGNRNATSREEASRIVDFVEEERMAEMRDLGKGVSCLVFLWLVSLITYLSKIIICN